MAGGHRFDGRYNANNNPSFTQTYTHQIPRFKLDNSGQQLSFSDYTAETDFVHLRRRDYNLLPQIFPDRKKGYIISSGVFQPGVDLPFLYTVDVTDSGYQPQVSFNQYLCNYHSAKAVLYDSLRNQMHTLFFGGMSQYYYQNGTLIQDNLVPFIKTISRLTRYKDGTLSEFLLPVEMPGLIGTSAEFIPNRQLKMFYNEITDLNTITSDSTLIGHIFGGILSPSLYPFANNLTNTTSADPSVYAVYLVRSATSAHQAIAGQHSFSISVFPNPTDSELIRFTATSTNLSGALRYFLTSPEGIILRQGSLPPASDNTYTVPVQGISDKMVVLTVISEGKYFATQKIMLK